jgi:hypothetical protein
MHVLLEYWLGLDSLEFCFEARDALNAAIRMAPGVQEGVLIVLNFLS